MGTAKVYRALGLMSGTSLDGVDVALIETDGERHVKPLNFLSVPYEPETREKIRLCLGLRGRADPGVAEAENLITAAHIQAIRRLGEKADIIGFHGQTIVHDPARHLTLQIGDGAALAKAAGVDVVNDFRSNDVKSGGQGAPFLPLYHQARARASGLRCPLAVLNLGGVGNVTWIGPKDDDLLAFDTGPGNALIDDFMLTRTGRTCDEDGKTAAAGQVEQDIVESFLSHPYFSMRPPKSLDRDMWDIAGVDYLSDADGAATLSAFTVESVRTAARLLPGVPDQWLVTGGGRHNAHIMRALEKTLMAPVKPVERCGWNGDALEAEGFAYLAVRSLLGKPLSLPSTTGVPKPMPGGVLHKA